MSSFILCSGIRKSDSCLIFLVQCCGASHFSIQLPADSIETEANIQSAPLLLMSRCDPQNLQPRSSVHDPNSYRSGTQTARTVATSHWLLGRRGIKWSFRWMENRDNADSAVWEVSCSFSPQRLGFHPRTFFVGFVWNKVALEQNFRQVFRVSPAVWAPQLVTQRRVLIFAY